MGVFEGLPAGGGRAIGGRRQGGVSDKFHSAHHRDNVHV